MKIVRTFEIEEFPNPHAISARLLHTGEKKERSSMQLLLANAALGAG